MAGLYFHIPFRRARRPYDDAYYEVLPDDASGDAALQRFVDAVDAELRLYARQHADDEPVRTIHAGGGRPSLLPIKHVRSLLSTVLEVFDTSVFQESTAEINPADATTSYLTGLHNLGFDRLSIEVLSFYPGDLRTLQAPHSGADAVRAIRAAKSTGFNTFAVDLAFGWPHQSMEMWERNVQQAIDMGVPGITLIECSPAPSEPLPEPSSGASSSSASSSGKSSSGKSSSGESAQANRDHADRDHADRDHAMQQAKQYRRAMELLDAHGYEGYELTHFARPGHASKHVRNTYAHGSYIGVGPSAESFWWPGRSPDRSATRWTNVSNVDEYARLLTNRYPPIAYRQTSDWTTLVREYIFFRLRTDDGLDLADLNDRYGYDLRGKRGAFLRKLVDNNLVDGLDNALLQLTPSGRLVADGITERLLPS